MTDEEKKAYLKEKLRQRAEMLRVSSVVCWFPVSSALLSIDVVAAVVELTSCCVLLVLISLTSL